MYKSYVDEGKATELLRELVKIDSVNPSLVPGAKGEKEIAEYVADWLKALGLETRVTEIDKGRYNTVGVLKGAGKGRSLMINGHLDTVGYDYMTIEPLKPSLKDGKLYGRGTNDMKGGLAASLSALKAVVDSGNQVQGDIIVAAVCDEEYASIGTTHLMKKTIVDAAIIGEPSGLNIVRCHKGFAWVDIETKGFAAHGSQWQTGIDAVAKMGRVLTGIETIDASLREKRHKLTGPASVHASIIKGGLELSTYPDKCLLQIERRLIPGESKKDVEEELDLLLKDIVAKDPKFSGSHNITFYRAPMEVPADTEICKTIVNAGRKVMGVKPSFIGSSGWMDTQIIWSKGIPAVSYGPIGEGSHAAVEWVDLKSVMDAARVQELVLKDFCGIKD